jgi:ketosteroid isomerase-like protein
MKAKWLWLFIIAGFCSCSHLADDAARVREIITAFHSAFDQKNTAALCALSTPDMQWYTLNGKAIPCADLASFFQPLFDRWLSVRTELKEVTIEQSAEIAVARYKSRMTLTYANNETNMNNLHTMVLKRYHRTWQVWQHHMSTE